MPDGDIYETTWDRTYAGQNLATVFHFVQVGIDSTGEARDSLNLMFEESLQTPALNLLSDGLTSVGVRSRQIAPTESQALTRTLSESGTEAGPAMPPNFNGVIRTYGPLSGRKGIGRIMVPGIPDEDIIKGRLNADQITARNAFAVLLEDDLDDGTTSWLWHAAVFSRIDLVARKIESAGMLTQIKTLRSRSRSA